MSLTTDTSLSDTGSGQSSNSGVKNSGKGETEDVSAPLQPWKVECVLADRGWILERLAIEIAKAAAAVADVEVQLVDKPTGTADLTYFLPYSVQKPLDNSLVVSYFSHQEIVEPAHSNFIAKSLESDHCIVSARKYQKLLEDAGAKSVSLIYLATDLSAFQPKLTLGVVGRTYHTGRKGEELVAQLMDLPFVDFVFTGEGWPQKPKYFPGEVGMQKFYQEIDYLLIPASIEGGPVPLFEALASGCEVISSDVGCVEDFPHIPFKTGDAGNLRQVLKSLFEKKLALRQSVEEHDWSNYGASHVNEFRNLLEQSERTRKPVISQTEIAESELATPTAWLVMHGSESTSKGGPTTRISAVADHVKTQMNCELTYSLDDQEEQGAKTDIAHVFNSWPLSSAIKEVARAKVMASRVIYSPITLNLAYLPYYANFVPELLSESSEAAERGMQQLVQDTQPLGFDKPVKLQGTPKHFQSLYASAQRADHLVFLSEYEERLLRGLGVDTPGTIVRNGVDAKTMASGDPEEFCQHYGVRNFILCVGRIEARKNLAALALAAKDLDATLVCIGHVGDQGYFELVKKHAGNNLLHIDRIEDRQLLASAYAAARCKVLCSWAEGAPLAVLEAGAAGTPLIVSNLGAEKEYCGDWASYIHPADIAGLRAELVRLTTNPESTEQRAERSRHFCKNYTLEGHAAATSDLYKRLLKEPAPTPRSEAQWLDVTHLAHTLSNKQVVTGVNSLEQSVADELQQHAHSHITLWNSPRNQFVPVNKERWSDDSFSKLANEKEQQGSTGNTGFSELEVTVAGSKRPPVAEPVNNSGANDKRLAPARLAKTIVKSSLGKLPGPLKERAVVAIRKVRPDFIADIEPQHQLGKAGLVNLASSAGETQHTSITRRVKTVDINDLELQRSGLISRGDRYIVLGQPWISNDRYLAKLIELIDETGASLEAMVPDILYVTRTMSFDKETRATYRRRLELLLSRCTRVYTISQQAAREIRDLVSLLKLRIDVSVITMGLPQITSDNEPCTPLQDKKFFVYVSSLNTRKNHEFLLDVWAEVRRQLNPEQRNEWRMALVGNPQRGFEHFANAETLQKLERDQGVLLLRGVGDAQLNWIYDRCAFTVYPSISEGWGFPVQESLAEGKVCVVSNTVPAAEETMNAALRKLAPDDFMGWVKTLCTLVQNEKQRLALQQHADGWQPESWDAAVRVISQQKR